MPRIKSSIKDVRRTATRRARNKQAMSTVRTSLRKGRAAAGETKEQAIKDTIKIIDKAIQNGHLHKNTGARYKSRLTKTKKAA